MSSGVRHLSAKVAMRRGGYTVATRVGAGVPYGLPVGARQPDCASTHLKRSCPKVPPRSTSSSRATAAVACQVSQSVRHRAPTLTASLAQLAGPKAGEAGQAEASTIFSLLVDPCRAIAGQAWEASHHAH